MLFGKYEFQCSFKSDAILPYFKGSTFRGVFGRALKQVVCALKRQECEQCLLKRQCVYALVFETSESLTMPEGLRMASPPHPYVIESPLTIQTQFREGDAFDFSLLLFGEVNKSLPYFIYAFDQMGSIGIGKRINGRRGQFVLEAVKHKGKCIYSNADQKLKHPESLDDLYVPENTGCPDDTYRVKIILETPLRIKFENHLNADLPFHVLIRAALRRVSSLSACYGSGEPEIDYRGLVKSAQSVRIVDADLKWFDWRRYSLRQDQEMLMGGMVGSVTYEGSLEVYIPLLEFCEQVHLGKQTAFGLGKVKMNMESPRKNIEYRMSNVQYRRVEKE